MEGVFETELRTWPEPLTRQGIKLQGFFLNWIKLFTTRIYRKYIDMYNEVLEYRTGQYGNTNSGMRAVVVGGSGNSILCDEGNSYGAVLVPAQ